LWSRAACATKAPVLGVKSTRAVEATLVLALLGALAGQLAWGIASDGMTNDEVLYVSAGYRQLKLGDYRLSPTHPPLAPSLVGLGLVGMPLDVPPLVPNQGVLDWCWQFVHARNDAGEILARARVPVALLTLLLAGVVWAWARAVAGRVAGAAALFLVAFHPSFVADGHLATTDMPAAFFTLLAAWTFWHWLRAPGPARALLVASALGFAAATRITAGVAVPVFLVVWVVALRHKRSPAFVRSSLVLVLVVALVVPAAVWAAYGFHDAPWPDELVRPPRVGGVAGRLIDGLEAVHVFPAGYVGSLRFQVEHNREGHPAYLLGERRKTGWWYYQAVAFGVKNTPGFLLALAIAAFAFFRRPRAAPQAPIGLWLGLAMAVFVTASLARIQIGERYLLAAYPFLILFVASAVPRVLEARRGGLVVLALGLLHAGPTLLAAPGGEIAYFNSLAGGRLGGHRVLLDSNLDWGQDLPRLAAWMRREGVASVQLAYQGADDPARFGITHEDLPGEHLYPARPPATPFDGVVAVSPNLLYGLLPRLGDPYATLRGRPPDARAGVFFVYRMGGR
jgi:Dolichyl-phosphate-mannose-protein mannosyltransferase